MYLALLTYWDVGPFGERKSSLKAISSDDKTQTALLLLPSLLSHLTACSSPALRRLFYSHLYVLAHFCKHSYFQIWSHYMSFDSVLQIVLCILKMLENIIT